MVHSFVNELTSHAARISTIYSAFCRHHCFFVLFCFVAVHLFCFVSFSDLPSIFILSDWFQFDFPDEPSASRSICCVRYFCIIESRLYVSISVVCLNFSCMFESQLLVCFNIKLISPAQYIAYFIPMFILASVFILLWDILLQIYDIFLNLFYYFLKFIFFFL